MADSKYAWIINESHDWPPPGHPKTPISPSMYENLCQCRSARRVREEARAIMRHPQNPEHLANRGPECRYCEFRPWCRPFWNNQSEPIDDYMFTKRGQAGFEATVTLFLATIDVTLFELETCGRTIELRFPKNQFPHLEGVRAGDRLRVLDTHLVGVVGRPTADITKRTEIYKIQSNKMGDPSKRG